MAVLEPHLDPDAQVRFQPSYPCHARHTCSPFRDRGLCTSCAVDEHIEEAPEMQHSFIMLSSGSTWTVMVVMATKDQFLLRSQAAAESAHLS